MLYKELFPEDFYKFINHEGVIIDIINKFKEKKSIVLNELYDKIEKKEKSKKQYELANDIENMSVIEKEIQDLEDEISELNSESIKNFMDNHGQYNQECLSNVTKLSNKNERYIDFIKFAIRNGYIDTDYSNYIHRFNEGSRTREDNDFVVKIRSLNNVDNFDYKINDVESVVNVLVDTDYAKSDSVNLNILKELKLLNENDIYIFKYTYK